MVYEFTMLLFVENNIKLLLSKKLKHFKIVIKPRLATCNDNPQNKKPNPTPYIKTTYKRLHATLEKNTKHKSKCKSKNIKIIHKKKRANITHLVFTNVFKFFGLNP
jgi:hypothetical protein